MISIATLKLVYPLLPPHFLTPTSMWHLLTSRARELGCKQVVEPFFDWLHVHMKAPVWAIVGLKSVNLTNSKLQKHQALEEQLVPNTLPPSTPRYLSLVPMRTTPVNYPPTQAQLQTTGTAETRGENFRSLLRICKVVREEYFLYI